MAGDLQKHILGIKSLINNPELDKLSKTTGAIGEAFIDEHTRAGEFYGGKYANRPYSTVDLPLFFFGEFSIVEGSGNIKLTGDEGGPTVLLKKEEDFYWRKSKESGRSTAYMKDGYAGWLKKSRPGKSLGTVDLTYNGDMLRNLTFSVTVTSKGSEIEWYVRSPEDLKAYYTHIKRHWLGFFQKEIDRIIESAAKFIGEDAVKRLHS